ncbi:MAG: SGNH/GDSL hydrolase family protein [Clostridia bacterium]|nr:SGNH/GDSL hydrolase family protein [Clostridia bacterium]
MRKFAALFLAVACIMLCACSSGAGENGYPSAGNAAESAYVSVPAPEETAEEPAFSEPEEESSQYWKEVILELSAPEETPEVSAHPVGVASAVEPVYYPDDGRFVYYAFGDSIAAGYALKDPERGCYPALFAAMYEDCEYRNYASSGDMTSNMLRILNKIDISDADLITVSIGANDISRYLSDDLLYIYKEYKAGIFTEYAKSLIGMGDKARLEKFSATVKRVTDQDTLRKDAEKGIASAKLALVEIVEKLQEMAPHAVIILQTVYDPYKEMDIDLGDFFRLDIGTISEEMLGKFNRAVFRAAELYGCEVLDVYTVFDRSEEKLVNANINFSTGYEISLDPHPNARGHQVIAECLKQKWDSITGETNEE